MKKILLSIPVIAMMSLPVVASAHAHASYLIGGKQYDIVIGSLNEPITVDDKTGLDLRVISGGYMQKADDGDMEPAGGSPATGLEKDLKVELIAGGQKLTQDISPAYGQPGAYKTKFYPTIATTFSYRLFGTINSTPVDITFTCREEGATAQDEGEKEISQGVKQLLKGGGFGCPTKKEDLGFPEKSSSIAAVADTASSADTKALWGLGAGVLGILLGGFALMRRKS